MPYSYIFCSFRIRDAIRIRDKCNRACALTASGRVLLKRLQKLRFRYTSSIHKYSSIITLQTFPLGSPTTAYGIYHMCFNFREVYISRICNFRFFRVIKFVVAGNSGVEIFAGEMFADIRSESVYRNNIRQLQRICLKMSSYRMESCIRGFHIYNEVWTPFIGERLGCARERSNREDSFAVTMKRGTETVGHVPRTIACVCKLFLRQRGSISCEVTGSSRPSAPTNRHFSYA